VNCDPIARWYRWLEYLGFGGALERRRCAFLAEVSNARRILALGDGDGRFLARLVERMNPETEIDYIDLSRRMLELARRRIEASGHAHPVTFLQADALAVALPSPSMISSSRTSFSIASTKPKPRNSCTGSPMRRSLTRVG